MDEWEPAGRAPPPPARRCIGLLRHSVRRDDDDNDDHDDAPPRDGPKDDGSPAILDDDDDQDRDPRHQWPDRPARPYDPPVVDFDLPARAALRLRKYGFARVVSSPFRRCLQTAAVAADRLGVGTVDVHLGIGEAMAQVRRCGVVHRGGRTAGMEFELTYLTREEMESTLAAAVSAPSSDADEPPRRPPPPRLGEISGDEPTFEEDDVLRIQRALRDVAAAVPMSGSVLLVTHGDILGQWVQMATGETVLECDYCGWAVYGAPSGDKEGGAAPEDYSRVEDWGIASVVLEE